MKVRIVNDGKHAYATKITTEDGQELQYVTKIEIDIDYNLAQLHPKAIITTVFPVIDIIADAEIKRVCPCCGRPVDEEGKQL